MAEKDDVKRLRIKAALDEIQEAQMCLGRAQAHLSSLIGAIPEWTAAGKLYDRVHTFWYRARTLYDRPKVVLDHEPTARELKALPCQDLRPLERGN